MYQSISPSPASQMLRPLSIMALTPLKGKVILAPVHDPPMWKGLHMPGEGERYPQVGEVVCIGEVSEDIRLGDLALIQVESSDVARVYRRVFSVLLEDFGEALFNDEQEPVIRETVLAYRANPSDKNANIRALDLSGDGISFDASDVLDMQWKDTDTPGFSLLYPMNVRMFSMWDGTRAKLFYEVHEDHILGVIR